MYSFEGDYKRRPIQALGGASKKVNCHYQGHVREFQGNSGYSRESTVPKIPGGNSREFWSFSKIVIFFWILMVPVQHHCQYDVRKYKLANRVIPIMDQLPITKDIDTIGNSRPIHRVRELCYTHRVTTCHRNWRHRRLKTERWLPLKSINRNMTWLVIEQAWHTKFAVIG